MPSVPVVLSAPAISFVSFSPGGSPEKGKNKANKESWCFR